MRDQVGGLTDSCRCGGRAGGVMCEGERSGLSGNGKKVCLMNRDCQKMSCRQKAGAWGDGVRTWLILQVYAPCPTTPHMHTH